MASLKKGLDKFDIVTPMIAGMGGGTADYGESADEQSRHLKEKARVTAAGRNVKKRPTVNTSMLT